MEWKNNRIRIVLLVGWVMTVLPVVGFAVPKDDIKALCTGSRNSAKSAVEQLVTQPAESLFYWISTFSEYPKTDTIGKFAHFSRTFGENVRAPAFLYVPKCYDGSPLPMIVYLHGGNSKRAFDPYTDEILSKEPMMKLCEQNGWFYLFPEARFDCAWWSPNGMENVRTFIREAKRRYNIDDDRIAVTGFSDGASGAYFYALAMPNDFAQFFPWSGHMAAASLFGDWQLYVPNLRNRQVFATNGGKDRLYPTAKMLPMIQLAKRAGANLTHVSFDTADHNYGYLKLVYPGFIKRIENNRRDPFPKKIYWETSDPRIGSCDWIAIIKLSTQQKAALWYQDYNCGIPTGQIAYGFTPGQDESGTGLKVAVVDPKKETIAARLGFEPEDIIVAVDGQTLHSPNDFVQICGSKKSGDPITASIVRGGASQTLSAKFPAPESTPAFSHKSRSGAIVAEYDRNRFTIKTSRIKQFSILLSPKMIRFDQPVTVVVNDTPVFNQMIAMDSKFIVEQFLANRDRKALWTAKIEIEVP